MPYIKTAWQDGVTGITAARLNNLETQYENAIADTLQQEYDGTPTKKIIYVSTTGNDSNAGTSGSPLRNIQTAINKIKKFNGGIREVNIAPGTYTENVTTVNFVGATIILQGNNGCNLNGAQINENCKARIEVRGFNILVGNSSFIAEDCNDILFAACSHPNEGLGNINIKNSRARILTCSVNNSGFAALLASDNSNVVVEGLTGINTGTGIKSDASIVIVKSATITGFPNRETVNGGQIFE